ncbi:uncharacterized protein LOC131805726 [Musca domestica]|uniref:Uncharacterized protein LOC131805726 n=1 Tax=Musca domestica TaxID=7370 RepID=A0ABM3VHJ5_MUSDO|nr:uncharacterized protein LOC131805726 [Musca domestica]
MPSCQEMYSQQYTIFKVLDAMLQTARGRKYRSNTIPDMRKKVLEQWETFCRNDEALKKRDDKNENDPYYKEKAYEIAQKMKEDIWKILNDAEAEESHTVKISPQQGDSSPQEHSLNAPQLSFKLMEIGEVTNENHNKLARSLENQFNSNVAELNSMIKLVETKKDKIYLTKLLERLEVQMNRLLDIRSEMAREGAGNDFTEDQWEQSGEDFNKAQMQITELLTSLEAAQRKSVMVEKIKIPEFSGRREDWNSFYELFRTLVHEDKNDSDQEKLFRLRSALKGDALQIIQNMPLTSSAYEGALEALRKRYDNKRTLFTHYVDSLLDVPKINGSSVHSIKKLLDTAIESIEGIKSMNLKLGDAYPILAHIIVRKLDKETLLQYEQTIQKCTEIQDINDVLKFLEQRYQTLNSVWSIDDGDKQRFKRQYSFEVAATNSEENQIKCGYCKSFGHKIHQCQQYKTLTVKERVHDSTEAQLHGFADASEKAYAAVVYVKVNGVVQLVAAKSKVNPIKNRKTLPKLELCAANLLAKLMTKVMKILSIEANVFMWSDSSIALSWIRNSSSKDRFIRTRVKEIQQWVPAAKWQYVKSKENPADMGSRGISADKLPENNLWWNGPSWLMRDEESWDTKEPVYVNVAVTNANSGPNYFNHMVKDYSSFTRLKRVIAYVLRYIAKLRGKNFPDYLTVEELRAAEMFLIKGHQQQEFPEIVTRLKNNTPIDHKHKLASLNPFLDENGVLRVGGRLQLASLAYNRKHPIILNKSELSDLIIKDAHVKTLHGGNRIVEHLLKRKFWIIGLKNNVKRLNRGCVKCIRYKREKQCQLMGMLPEYRVNVSAPFTHCGVDYAGPIYMKCSNGRGQKTYKGYIAVFICMTTKAIHLEPVSSLTSEAFLAALKRLFARRGKSSHIYSDNGTNFVGTVKHLDRDLKAAMKENNALAPILATEGVQWHFIPPASPHFGGIWEAAVKSMKYHLRRVIGESKLTFEEMSTLLYQIEAVLNSRPLYNMDDNAGEVEVLTPGHFLIGRPLISYPETSDEHKITALDRWKQVQKMKNCFWKQWKSNYLETLQQRYKWKTEKKNIQRGQVVIVKNEETHPGRWPLGKVEDVHPGPDGLVRVATLKTQAGLIKRSVNKLCPLEGVKTDEKRDSSNGKRTGNLAGYLVLLLLALTQVKPTVADSLTNITELQESTALYLDQVGSVNVVASKWNMIIVFNMLPFLNPWRNARPC